MERKGVVTMKGAPVTLLGPELDVGEKVPGFTVLDRSLKEVTLDDFEGKIKVISVTPSLDTPVCDLQAHWFNEEASSLPGDVAVLNVSMDLPFAIHRFCLTGNVDHIKVLSDHRDGAFGLAYGVLIKELRLLARAIFVLDKNDVVRYGELVPEVTTPPDYDAALGAARKLL